MAGVVADERSSVAVCRAGGCKGPFLHEGSDALSRPSGAAAAAGGTRGGCSARTSAPAARIIHDRSHGERGVLGDLTGAGHGCWRSAHHLATTRFTSPSLMPDAVSVRPVNAIPLALA